MRDLLVYGHVPFCTSKCHFCDWVQEIPTADLLLRTGDARRAAYVDALCRQIREAGPRLRDAGYRPAILYWGGGTASILSVQEIKQLGAALHGSFDLGELREATIECSPETLTAEKLAAFRGVGFRRISVGAQSFDDRRLRRLGRSHDGAAAARAFELAAAAGFDDANVDLMCGFPDEDLAEVEHSVRSAVRLPVSHVSLYPFRPAPGTVLRRQLARGQSAVARNEQKLAYALGRTILAEAGFPEYAMSHFGTRRCHSDLAYFRLEMDWAGFGSGATSLLATEYLATRRGALAAYVRDPHAVDERFPAAAAAIAPRLMYQALSTFEGAVERHWRERTGCGLDDVLRVEGVAELVGYLGDLAGLERDAAGLRLRRAGIAEAFIDLQFASAPESGRRVRTAEGVLG
jgi:oxygen-independent coproporphyrinogen-3 oxidase